MKHKLNVKRKVNTMMLRHATNKTLLSSVRDLQIAVPAAPVESEYFNRHLVPIDALVKLCPNSNLPTPNNVNAGVGSVPPPLPGYLQTRHCVQLTNKPYGG